MHKHKKLQQAFLVGVLLVFAFAFVGCDTLVRDSYRTLSVSSATYEASMRSAADLFKQDRITLEQKEKILEIANQYWAAFHAATDLLEAYVIVESADGEQRLIVAMAEFMKVFGRFMDYVQPLIGGK